MMFIFIIVKHLQDPICYIPKKIGDFRVSHTHTHTQLLFITLKNVQMKWMPIVSNMWFNIWW